MRKRWMISLDDGVTFSTEIFPLKLGSLKFTRDAREGQLAKGRMFIRRHMNQPLELRGADYDLLYPYERNPSSRCTSIYVRQERYCAGTWSPFWTGRFSAGAGTWDHSHCWASFRVEVYDRYTCFLDHLNDRQNVLQVAPVNVRTAFLFSMEFFACWYLDAGEEAACYGEAGDPNVTGYDAVAFNSFSIGLDTYGVVAFGRRREVTICVGGNPVPPLGAGWILLENNCATDGTAVYVRRLTAGEIFLAVGSIVFGTCIGGQPIPPEDACAGYYLLNGCTDDGVPVMYVCLGPGAATNARARTLESILQYLIDKMGCDVSGVASDFLEINPPGDAVGYVAGLNYVTGEDNQVDHLLMLQKSDAAIPGAAEGATIGELTMDEALTFLRQMFNIYWDINSAGQLRLEHWSYWTFTEGLDLSVGAAFEANAGKCRYEHLATDTPKYERFKFAEAQGGDFVGADITYDCPSAQRESTVAETTVGIITTDISFVNFFPDQIEISRGFVMLATDFDGTDYATIIETGVLSGNLLTNTPLSWANLHDRYFRHNRYLLTGTMNRQPVIFDATRHTIEQVPLFVPMCCDLFYMDPNSAVKTELGERFLVGRQGVIFGEEIDDASNTMTITLRYAY